jgi:hypothetical protein
MPGRRELLVLLFCTVGGCVPRMNSYGTQYHSTGTGTVVRTVVEERMTMVQYTVMLSLSLSNDE